MIFLNESIKKVFLRILLVSISVLFLIGCDQTTKRVAHRELKNKANQEIAGIINLQFIENDGGMLSIGKDFPKEIKFVIFILIVSIFLVVLFLYIIKNEQETLLKLLALIFIFSGGIGNLIDRISNNGKVIDFIRLKLPLIESGIFNVADFYVTTGFLILLLSLFMKKKFIIRKKIV
jgi:signal peptidase II